MDGTCFRGRPAPQVRVAKDLAELSTWLLERPESCNILVAPKDPALADITAALGDDLGPLIVSIMHRFIATVGQEVRR